MDRVLLGLALWLSLYGSAHAEDPVYFADTNLKEAVEEKLWISDPTPTDMLGLDVLNAGSRRITSLTGLEYALNLRTLDLTHNQITGIAPLAGLTLLDSLDLRDNQISGISPVSGLTNLRTLQLNDNEIGDVSPVSGLTSLSTLDLHHNHVSSVSALSGLTSLHYLALRENPVTDVSPLSTLTNLHHLCILDTKVSDISPLTSLTSLGYLDLRHCPLSDDSWDIYLPQIRVNNPGIQIETDPHRGRLLWTSSTAGGSVIEPGEGEFLYSYDAFIRLTAQADPGYIFVGWSGTYPTMQNPTFLTMGRDYEMRAIFVSLRDTLYVDDDAPADPGRGDTEVSDPNEDGSPEHPFDRIQEAIEVAAPGVTIFVQPGTYRENLDLLGKSLDLTAVDPAAPAGGPCAVLEGSAGGPLVRFSGTGTKGRLSGFVLTRGQGQPAAALACDGASPTISHCLLVGNRTADPNGAVVYCHDSQAVLANCTIADNYGGAKGAALVLVDSDVTVTNSIFWGNRPQEIVKLGTSHPLIRYGDVQGWWPDYGNINLDPLFAQRGVWVNAADPGEVLGPEDDRARWTGGDYHLQSQAGRWDPGLGAWVQDEMSSPCIDAGEKTTAVGDEPAPHGGRINQGAYGGTAEASKSPDTAQP